MADVRTFRADSMQAALDMVRSEMGGEAVILHTRQLAKRRWLPWTKRDHEVEITAGLGVNVQRRVSRPAVKSPPARAVPHAVAMAAERTRSFHQVNDSGRSLDSEAASLQRRSSDGDTFTLSRATSSSGVTQTTLPTQSTAPPQKTSTPSRPAKPKHDAAAAAFATKLDSIHKMLEQLNRSRHTSGGDEIPTELFELYTELIDAEVEDDLARELVFRLKAECTPEQIADTAAAKARLAAMVEAEVRTGPPIVVAPGERKVVALVGPTGVGKTTTIAKLAANFRLRDGIKMGLVTVDTYRIAAVEQLRTYAEIIDLPMKVVTSPLEMRRALDELMGLDLVLIDTAGRSPRDDLQIQELKSLLNEADVDEVHLVLSMASSLRTLEATAEKFSPAGTTSLIMTKLDEAAGFGTLLSLSKKSSLPISYLTTGQDVPDDIEAAEASRIAGLVLGQQRLG